MAEAWPVQGFQVSGVSSRQLLKAEQSPVVGEKIKGEKNPKFRKIIIFLPSVSDTQ